MLKDSKTRSEWFDDEGKEVIRNKTYRMMIQEHYTRNLCKFITKHSMTPSLMSSLMKSSPCRYLECRRQFFQFTTVTRHKISLSNHLVSLILNILFLVATSPFTWAHTI